MDFDAALGFDPAIVVGEATIGADGADDGVTGDGRVGGALQDSVKDLSKVFAALGDEPYGMEVTI